LENLKLRFSNKNRHTNRWTLISVAAHINLCAYISQYSRNKCWTSSNIFPEKSAGPEIDGN